MLQKHLLVGMFLTFLIPVVSQVVWREQLIFKTTQYQKIGEMRGFVLLYSEEHRRLLALDAETGQAIPARYTANGSEIFLPVPKDKFIQKQIIFVGKKNQESWFLEILHYTGQEIAPTGQAFELPSETLRILSMNYRNGYIYYLLERKDNSLILQRKHIQCTAIGLPTFSNETSEGFYDSEIDKFLIESKFEILSDGLDAARDLVLIVGKGRKAPGRIIARASEWETIPNHTIVELPDKNTTITSPIGTNFNTLILNGTRQFGYDICILGSIQEQTRIFMRRMGEKDLEIQEAEALPLPSNPIYSEPFSLQGTWWFPFKTENGINLVYYMEKQGAVQFANNFLDISELYLISDEKDSSTLYGLSNNNFRKYILGRSMSDWESHGGFRSVEFGQKSLRNMPKNIAIGYLNSSSNTFQPFQVQGKPYKNDSYNLKPIEQLDIVENANKTNQYTYLTTKETSESFQITRKYCLNYNSEYQPSAPINTQSAYEYQLIWETSFGADKNIAGFYIPYLGQNTLLVKAVNNFYAIDCQEKSKARIQPFYFSKINIPDGIYSSDWYKKDLRNIKKIEYLGILQEHEHYLVITQSNIYQGLLDKQGNFLLIEATGITGPISTITFATLTEDNSTLLCGGLTEQGRAFFAQLYLLPGNESKLPSFSGIIDLYVQNLEEQEERKPQKMLSWGENIYILTLRGQIEFYEKSQGSFNLAGTITLENETILGIEIFDNVLCILGNRNLYSLDLRTKEIGTSLQTHFNETKAQNTFEYDEEPQHVTRHGDILFVHFPHRLCSWKIQENILTNHRLLIEERNPLIGGFQICPLQTSFYISADKKIYEWSLKNVETQALLPIFSEVSCNIFRLFPNPTNKQIYYISQEGEIASLQTQQN